MLKYILIIMVILISQEACKSIDEQLLCFKEQQIKLKKNELNKEIVNQFSDSLNLWFSKDLYGVMRFKKENYKIDDNIYINSSNDKCVMAILKIDTAATNPSYDIELVFGRLIDIKKWQFMMSSMPVITYKLGDVHKERVGSFEAMSNFLPKRLIESGYFKKGQCEIDDNYVNGWLNDYLVKYHQEFLEGKRL